MSRDHDWSELQGDQWLLECTRTGIDFWDVERGKFEYCPACGSEL